MAFDRSHTLIQGRADNGLILLCDHASNALPAEYGSLGLPAGQLERHIGYDIGAADMTRALAATFDAPALLANFSRLLIDPNRGEDDPTLLMKLSDGAVVPGNADAGEAERSARLARFHRPYHLAIDEAIAASLALDVVPVLVSIHSFTDNWRGWDRPWHLGCLWDQDDRAPKHFLDAFSTDETVVVGDNEPYTGALKNDCMYHHGTALGIAHILIEVRQDLIADRTGAEQWAERLVPALQAINSDPDCHVVRHFGSRTGPVDPRPLPTS